MSIGGQAAAVPRGVLGGARRAGTSHDPSTPAGLATSIVDRVAAVLHELDRAQPPPDTPAQAAARALGAGMCQVAAFLVAPAADGDAGWRQAVFGLKQAARAGSDATDLLGGDGAHTALAAAVRALGALVDPMVDVLTAAHARDLAAPAPAEATAPTETTVSAQSAPAEIVVPVGRRQPWWGSR